MRSYKNGFFIALGIAILLAQVLYYFTFHKEIIADIRELQNQNTLKFAELSAQEKSLKNLPVLRKELEEIKAQTNAVKNSIPNTISAAKEFIELMRLMETNQFIDVKIEKIEEISHDNEVGNFLEKKYKLTYTSTYYESKMFLQNLNTSYQLINIASYKIDNSPQKDKENIRLWIHYGSAMKSVVSSTVEFSMFMISGETAEDEIYTSTFNNLSGTEDAFLNTEGEVQELNVLGSHLSEENIVQPTQQKQQSNSSFKLELWDVLASGDNYSFVGPTGVDPLYTGLKTSKDTYMTLNIREDGYDVTLEDESGNVKKNSATVPIQNPRLRIESNIVKIQEQMPHIHIYINNYSQHVIEVTLKGSLLETVHIYNEHKEEVKKGQTKGKVNLT